MTYNFDEIVDRSGTDTLKADFCKAYFGTDDLLPMWVADMDFKVPQPVAEAIQNRAAHQVYGYTRLGKNFEQSIVDWVKRRHQWDIRRNWVMFSPGVVPTLVMCVLGFSQPGDEIIVQSPVYYPFFDSIKHNGRQILNNPLKLVDGKHMIDFDDLRAKITPRTKMIFLCSPHNPGGRVWTREELLELGEICIEKNILIVSDEIHADIIYPGNKHIPMASLSDDIAKRTITCMAPSKTFNIAGLGTSYVVISDPKLHAQYRNMLFGLQLHGSSPFGITALEAAYTHGEEWLEQLLVYLKGNLDYLETYVREHIPRIIVIKPESTYLAWLDCSGLGLGEQELRSFFIKKAKVGLNNGPTFGEGGQGFQRLNFACPRQVLQEGLQRIEQAVNQLPQ